ncbi:hypothetical protein COL940_000594 [Colletotrichum noveboracense]|nr:hypothetical protein COL940_000594 [Colletotrichum noveboracense]KAJ0294975.1 hypothetical protein CBS470a_000016 [Colletotrichum nupharicola]
MCIQLWRRYFCPKAPDFGPLPANAFTVPHPRPSPSGHPHHLVNQEENIFRENWEDPHDQVPNGKHIHWMANWIRCSHNYHRQCDELSNDMKKIQYIGTACPFCKGDIDVHVKRREDVFGEWDIHPKIPVENDPDQQLAARFDAYKEYYILRLLLLMHRILTSPYPIASESLEWSQIIDTCWQETFCKVVFSHVGHAMDVCDCPSTKEEWRVNPAITLRKNEAESVLEGIDKIPRGQRERFWMGRIFRYDAATNVYTEDWTVTDRARQIYGLYRASDFPEYQMQYVDVDFDACAKRYDRLVDLGDDCHEELIKRGPQVSQSYPYNNATFHTRRVQWMDLDNWPSALLRRETLLQWIFMFLAYDAGLDEEVMMFLGGALLAILNPYPSIRTRSHPSHKKPECLDPDLAAWDVLQECVFELENHWPLLARRSEIQENLYDAAHETSALVKLIRRNRRIIANDINSRNQAADRGVKAFAVKPQEAINQGQTQCSVCTDTWGSQPFHQPVKMPCCKAFVGARCLKQWLASRPLRGAEEDVSEDDATWAQGWKCLLCRAPIGDKFRPKLREHQRLGPENLRDLAFNNVSKSFEQPSWWWGSKLFEHQMNGGPSQS